MKNILCTLAISAATLASAGEVAFSCIGPDSDDCSIRVDATISNERLTAMLSTGERPGDVDSTETLGWCGPGDVQTNGYAGWFKFPECHTVGNFRVINGELTKRQLAEGKVTFIFTKVAGICNTTSSTDKKPQCFNR